MASLPAAFASPDVGLPRFAGLFGEGREEICDGAA